MSASSGAPSPEDVAVALGRIFRFAGATVRPWTVLQHSMVVADLVPSDLRVPALLHDCEEALTSDVPSPFKTPDFIRQAKGLRSRIFKAWGIELPNLEAERQIHAADQKALAGEMYVLGSDAMRKALRWRSPTAEALVLLYEGFFTTADCAKPDSYAVKKFLTRLGSTGTPGEHKTDSYSLQMTAPR